MPTPKAPIPLEYAESTKELRLRVMTRRISKILIIVGILVFVAYIPAAMYWHAQAKQYQCAQNLRAIYDAMLLYTNENRGQLPPDLPTLAASECFSPSVFTCPSSSDTPASGGTPELALAEMAKPGHVSYIYLHPPQPITPMTPRDLVLLYEQSSHLNGIHVLMLDGSVMQLNAAETKQFKANLAAGNPRLTAPIPAPATLP